MAATMSFPNKVELNKLNQVESAIGQPAKDDIGLKLLRETEVFLGGTVTGIGKGLCEKFDSPGNLGGTALELGGAYAAGHLLSRLQPKAALGLLTKQAVGLAFSYSYCKDVGSKLGLMPKVWEETWHSNHGTKENQKLVADTWGRFAVDSTLTGALATRAAKNKFFSTQSRNITREIAELLPRQNIVRIETAHGYGSGFVVDDYHIATAAHVASEGGYLGTVNIATATGARMEARMVAMHPHADVALLRTDMPHGLKPLPVAESTSSLPEGTRVSELGAHGPGSRGPAFFRVAPGKLNSEKTFAEFNAKLKSDLNLMEKASLSLVTKLYSRLGLVDGVDRTYLQHKLLSANVVGSSQGLSGGAVIDLERKQVIGVVSCGPLLVRDEMPSIHVPAERIHELSKLNQRLQQAETGVGRLSMAGASQHWNISEKEIAQGIKSGKIDAVQLFASPHETRNYMVLLDREPMPQYVLGRQVLKRVNDQRKHSLQREAT